MTLRTVSVVLVLLALSLAAAPASVAGELQAFFIELDEPAPTVVARHEAERAGRVFDEELHRARVRLAQDALLQRLTQAAVPYGMTRTEIVRGLSTFAERETVSRDNRYTELINAVRLELRASDAETIRTLRGVKHVSKDRNSRLQLNKSVAYVRANGPNSARTLGIRGTGQINPDGSTSGQVIAVMDTGIDQTNPMFDTQVDDTQFENRVGDSRAVRLQGSPYVDGVNHPKVVYRFLVGTAPVEGDDTGHGTNTSSTAAGLKARADDILNNGEIVEGVAPGALLMDYKVCPSLVCVNAQLVLALEDCILPTDPAGFPKPVCTVVNMSLGSDTGDPNSADGIAAGNLQFAGVIPVAAAGNAGPQENIIGSPSAHRRVMSVAATTDPGVAPNSIDVLQQNAALRSTPGSPPNADLFPDTGDNFIAFISPESNGAMPLDPAMAQHYVDVALGDTPEQVPSSVNGRVCLAERGSTVDSDQGGTGLFGNKAAQCAARGGIAVVIFNNEPGQVGVVLGPSPIPIFTTSRAAGLFLRDTLGYESAAFGAVSNFPIRLNPTDPGAFIPDTAGFSSRGPNNDFAVVKPDIGAPGVQVLMGASKAGALGSPTSFTAADGTSFASPHVAGLAALLRDPAANPGLAPSQVRSALTNTATHLREADGTPIPDNDLNVLIHEVGAGLADALAAVNAGAVMGTNSVNGAGGPDDSSHPDFLPTHSFGQRGWIGTNLPPANPAQQATITVTLDDLDGGDLYNLSIVDGGALRGDITRPLSEPGFSVSLSTPTVVLPPGGTTTFDVSVAVDGQPGGLALAGADVNGAVATEFLWYVIATSIDESLRMPFYLRVVQGSEPGNFDPVPIDDNENTPRNTAVTIDVLANDSDPDNDPLTVTQVSQPSDGSADINPDNTVTYTPDDGFLGNDTFTYTVSDGRGGTAPANVTVTVFDPMGNLPPDPADDEARTELNTPVTIHVLANDSDPNGDPLTLSAVGSASSGATGVNPDGSASYSPNAGFQGVDSFDYTVCDDENACDTAVVTVVVGCPPTPTGAFSDDFEPGAEPGWANDTPVNLNPGSSNWSVVVDPLTQSPTNAFSSDANGLDSKDDRLIAPPQTPSALSQLVFWHRFDTESSFDGGVLEVSTDGGAGWVDIVTAGGSFIEGGYNGAIDPGFNSPIAGRNAWTGFSQFIDAMNRVVVDIGSLAGAETLFRWRLVQDPFVAGSIAGQGWWIDDVSFSNTLVPTVPCLLPPNAFDDRGATAENTAVTIDVLANDSDPDGDPISVASVGQASDGAAANNFDGTVTYTPNNGVTGFDSFSYTVCDDGDLCSSATVRVEICGVPSGIAEIAIGVSGGDTLLGWAPVAGAANYDVIAGDLRTLLDGGGDYASAVDQCTSDNGSATSVVINGPVPAGEGRFFLVRPVGCAAGTEGTYDSGSPRQVGGRDTGIAGSPAACP